MMMMGRLWFNLFLWVTTTIVWFFFVAGLPEAKEFAGRNDLVQMVLQEAALEPISGQMAIAGVALDRVTDPRWPDTLAAVLYQPKQFTGLWVPQRKWSKKQIERARLAVWAARVGARPCGYDLFWYHATYIKKPSHWPAMEVRCTLGLHVFYGDKNNP